MARSKRGNTLYKGVGIVFVGWFALLTYQRNLFGTLGLGALLLVAGIWMLATAQTTWNNYVRWYNHAPTNKKTEWNRPRRRYYYLNVVVVAPVLIALGIATLYLAYGTNFAR